MDAVEILRYLCHEYGPPLCIREIVKPVQFFGEISRLAEGNAVEAERARYAISSSKTWEEAYDKAVHLETCT